MHAKSGNIEIMISDEADDVYNKNRCQITLQPMRGTEFVFDYVQLLYYKCHKINLNHGGSYIDSPWLDEKQKTINKSYQ